MSIFDNLRKPFFRETFQTICFIPNRKTLTFRLIREERTFWKLLFSKNTCSKIVKPVRQFLKNLITFLITDPVVSNRAQSIASDAFSYPAPR